ncbi:CARDB domain-containing protein [Pyxidicoccus sp. 3LG]
MTRIQAPPSARPGESFAVNVTVCNQGTEPANTYYPGPSLDLYLSTDESLTPPNSGAPYPTDQELIGGTNVPPLDPGQCVTQSLWAYASLPQDAQPDGALYLGAIVDGYEVLLESREDNNAHLAGLMGVGLRPDLVVTKVEAPASVRTGGPFTATVTVCNQGTESTVSSAQPTVELYLSLDESIVAQQQGTPPPTDQQLVGTVTVPTLSAGQCVRRSVVDASANLPQDAQGDGAYFLGAIVDTFQVEPELREDNNLQVSGRMGVGQRSDLVVTKVEAPASRTPGQGFTATVTVCNQGTEPYAYPAQPTVELYLSLDDSIVVQPGAPLPAELLMIGTVMLPSLNAGQCLSRNVLAFVNLPQDDGVYFLAAIVDPHQVVPELREDNNLHIGGALGVGYRADLVVTEVSGPASRTPGQSFIATAKVCNQGTTDTIGYSSLELYLSREAVLTPPPASMPTMPPLDQVFIGSTSVPPLSAGQCASLAVNATAEQPSSAQGDGAFYLGAIVDPWRAEPELREDNNLHVGGLMGVGYRPDLVVTRVSAPVSVRNGHSFTASVTVCNQGTQNTYDGWYSQNPRVEVYLSMGPALALPPASGSSAPTDNQMIASVDLPHLNAGECTTHEVTAYAQTPPDATGEGAFYLGAIVDAPRAHQELREDNNVHVAGLMGVGQRSDLVVTGVRAPASARGGDDFTATVTVCNQGTEPSDWSNFVELYLSMDATLTPPGASDPMPTDQQLIGAYGVPQLHPGRCADVRVDVHVVLPPDALGAPGAYFLGAIVDVYRSELELREDNNVHIAGLMGVGERPDLVVTEVRAPASVRSGTSFDATVKVCNQGTEPTNGWYNGAAVELYLSTSPALALHPVFGPSTPSPDQEMIGSATVTRSLHPGECESLSFTAYASRPPSAQEDGAFYLGAIVDALHAQEELREDNNVHIAGLMGVGHRADLVVKEVKAPASARPGDSFDATVKVCNQGTEPTHSGSSSVELYLSMDTALTSPSTWGSGSPPTDQRMIGSAYVPQLQPGQCVSLSVDATADGPLDAQWEQTSLYLGAIVDAQQAEQELREDNNAYVSGLMGVGHEPDLVVTEVRGPASRNHGDSFDATVTVCNQGTESTGNWFSQPRVELYLSRDTTVTPPPTSGPSHPPEDQRVVGFVDLPHLSAGQCVTRTVNATAQPPYPQGPELETAFYLAAIVDTADTEEELREDNNLHVGGLIGVGNLADLVVTEVKGPASARHGDPFTATVKVCNQGTQLSGGWYGQGRLELYLSADDTLATPTNGGPMTNPMDQQLVASEDLPPLQPGQCTTRVMYAHAETPPGMFQERAWYLGATIDALAAEQELREDNNSHVGGLMGVGNLADLVVTEVSGPVSVREGEPFDATVKVCNQGTEGSGGWFGQARLELYQARGPTLLFPEDGMPLPDEREQRRIGAVDVSSLAAGQCQTLSVPVFATSVDDETVYYLGAIVDTNRYEQELREDNNTFVGGQLSVGNDPDFVVTAISGPASVRSGLPFDAQVTVCNHGTEEGYNPFVTTQVQLYLSLDTDVEPPGPWSSGQDQSMVGSAELAPLAAGQCVTLTVPATASLPPGSQGDPEVVYLAAIVDVQDVVGELREGNNVTVGGLMGVGDGPDLVVKTLSAPSSVQQGADFTASVEVCNQGTLDFVATYEGPALGLLISLDSTLSPQTPWPTAPDQEMVGSVQLASLAAGQCMTLDVQANAWLPQAANGAGSYFLGAFIDVYQGAQELREDNNTRADFALEVTW